MILAKENDGIFTCPIGILYSTFQRSTSIFASDTIDIVFISIIINVNRSNRVCLDLIQI